jgi:hypothetical protein
MNRKYTPFTFSAQLFNSFPFVKLFYILLFSFFLVFSLQLYSKQKALLKVSSSLKDLHSLAKEKIVEDQNLEEFSLPCFSKSENDLHAFFRTIEIGEGLQTEDDSCFLFVSRFHEEILSSNLKEQTLVLSSSSPLFLSGKKLGYLLNYLSSSLKWKGCQTRVGSIAIEKLSSEDINHFYKVELSLLSKQRFKYE